MPDSNRLNQALGDRYRVVRELGAGGMARVYLAEDLKHAREVAIKVLRPELSEATGPARFLQEIEVAARLNHPNILALHDSGEADGLLYFVMPYVDGESLRDVLDREGTLSFEDAVRIAREVGSALEYAHEHGLVHRDIKPENILFQAGHAVVCDFGIAKVADEAKERMTRTGVSVGTLSYMSPEQLTGDAPVDARSDVYALGCVLHEMLAGEVPHEASSQQATIAKKLMGAPPGALDRPDVPATVRQVIVRALSASPDDRFNGAGSFVAELDDATTTVAIERDERRRRRGKALRYTTTLAVIGVLGALGWWATSHIQAPEFERIAVLAFENAANDSMDDYLVQGVHEDLVVELQRAGVRVINPRSVRRYVDSDHTLRQIADELSVDGIIEGSAERIGSFDASAREGDRIEIELTLTDPATDELVWVRSFSSVERNVLGLLRDMTQAIADQIGIDLTAEARARLAQAPEVDPLVYEAILQGRYERLKLTPEGLDRAEDYYALALARDSAAVRAWVGLAQVWNTRAQQGFLSMDRATELAEPYLARARALDPAMGRDYAFIGTTLAWPRWREGRWGEAEEAFRSALEQDPTDAVARAYFALLLLYTAQTEEAEEQTYRAAQQAPDDPLVQGIHAQALNALHRWEEAEAALTRARRFEPEAPILLSTLRTIYHLLGRHEEAIASWRDSYRSSGDLEALEALDRGYGSGGYEAALRSVAELFVGRLETARARGDDSTRPWQVGTLYTRAGMYDEAIGYLEQAADEGDPNVPYLSVDAIFDPMRDDPRFQALVDRLDLPEPAGE